MICALLELLGVVFGIFWNSGRNSKDCLTTNEDQSKESDMNKFIEQLVISQPNMSLHELTVVFNNTMDRKPTVKEMTFFLKIINLNKSSSTHSNSSSTHSNSTHSNSSSTHSNSSSTCFNLSLSSSSNHNSTSAPELTELLHEMKEINILQTLLHRAETRPASMPYPINTTAAALANITGIRARRAAMLGVLEQFERLGSLLPLSALKVVQQYVEDIELLPAPDDSKEEDEQSKLYYQNAINVLFPQDSLKLLIMEHNRLLNGSVYKESLKQLRNFEASYFNQPDYFREVVKNTWGDPEFVAEENGWVFVKASQDIHNPVKFEINHLNRSVFHELTGLFPVRKGDRYKLSGGFKRLIVFYPCWRFPEKSENETN